MRIQKLAKGPSRDKRWACSRIVTDSFCYLMNLETFLSLWNRDIDLWGESTFKEILITLHLWGGMTELVLQVEKEGSNWHQLVLETTAALNLTVGKGEMWCAESQSQHHQMKSGRRSFELRDSNLITGTLRYSDFSISNSVVKSTLHSIFLNIMNTCGRDSYFPSKIYSSLP